jgi:hypothetical protein
MTLYFLEIFIDLMINHKYRGDAVKQMHPSLDGKNPPEK